MRKYFKFLSKNLLLSLAAGSLFLLALFIFLFTETFYELIEFASIWVREIFGGFYLWLGLICVLFLLFIAFSKFGKIKLGNTPPEFDRLSWIAMLYSAGMGAGILLRAVQEPVFMFMNPPISNGSTAEIISLEYTFYQWGFTAWAFYGIFALLIAYNLFVRKSNILLGSSLPQLKKMKFLPAGVNLITILTTVFGLVAAVGLGTTQIEGGISHLVSKPAGSLWLIILLVLVICILAFISAFAGIKKGIKRISNWNIYITVFLMLFVFWILRIKLRQAFRSNCASDFGSNCATLT